MSDRQLESAARMVPLLILVYFAAQFLIRVLFSANLETDEAQFVGQTHLALGYGNSHPPLYNWLVAGALALTGGHWASAMALIKNLLLAGTYLLAFDAVRQVTGRALTGAIVAASFLMLPQIVWKSQVTLAHSVLVMFAVVATLHAIVCIARRGDWLSFLWLGLAATVGTLAKYNFLLTLAALMAATLSIPDIRRRVFTPRLAAAAGLGAALFAPHAIWALLHLSQTTQRMEKMERGSGTFGGIDLPLVGIDGLLDFLLAIVAWAAPLLLAWYVIRFFTRTDAGGPHVPDDPLIDSFRKLFGRTTLIGMGAFAAIILAGDLHSVHERYLTPLLMPLPFWLAIALPLEARGAAPVHFLRVAGVVALLMLTAWPAWIALGREQFAYPYGAIAAALDKAVTGPFTVLGPQYKHAANIAIRLERAGMWDAASPGDQVVLLWEAKAGRSPTGLVAQLGADFEPHGAPIALAYPYDNFSGEIARLNAQVYARRP